MPYLRGTIIREDGKRMTRKYAESLFDAFLEWLDEEQDCAFAGCFDLVWKDGGKTASTTATFNRPWSSDLKWTTVPRKLKTTKRKTKRKKKP